MTHNFDIEALVAGFASTVLPKGHPGVYEIKGGSKTVEVQRLRLVRQLFELFPTRLIWLKDTNADQETMLGSPISLAGEAGIWMLADTISLTELLDKLYEGGWGMFFLQNPPQHVPTPPELLPTKPEEIRMLLRTLGASIGILSWYDDLEWLLVSHVEQN